VRATSTYPVMAQRLIRGVATYPAMARGIIRWPIGKEKIAVPC
jgi:hypothetical protein